MKASDPNPKHGEIWYVNFEPSAGHEYQGMRPALVVQAVGLETSRLITVVPITTKIEKGELCDIVIVRDKENKLCRDSLAKIQFVQSFDRSRLDYCIGRVSGEAMEKIKESLRVHFGIGD